MDTTTGTPAAGLDPQLVNLARAIRQTESQNNFQATGKSGEFGAYQWMPETWNAQSKMAGVNVPLQQATPEQQNEVAYKTLASWKQQHPDWNVGNFASAWNAGEGNPDAYLNGNQGVNSKGVSYNTPAYAQQVAQNYQTFKSQSQTQPIQTTQPTTPDTTNSLPTYGATFAASPNDTPLTAAAKYVGNIPSSAFNAGAGIVNTVFHPIKTLEGLGQTALGGIEKISGQAPDTNTQAFDTFVQGLKDRYGSLHAVQNTLENDPVGFITDVASIADPALRAAGVGKGALLDSAISKTGEAVTKPIANTVAGAVDTAGNVAKFGVGQLTGLEPGTLSQILSNPEKFTSEAIANSSRADLANEIGSALNDKLDALKDTGEQYNPIRDLQAPNLDVFPGETKTIPAGNGLNFEYNLKDIPDDQLSLPELRKKVQLLQGDGEVSPEDVQASEKNLAARAEVETVPHTVKVPKNFLVNQLKQEAGVAVKDGKVVADLSSKVNSTKDLNALQNLYDLSKPAFEKGSLTTEEFLNFRAKLAELARYDREIGKSTDLEAIAKNIRSNFNSRFRKQIPGLENLDNEYSTQTEELQRLRKGLIDRDGNLLDSAINKVANATGKGKDQLLERLEEILPGVTQKIKIQKAIEDIHAAEGNKVGTYARNIGGTGLIGGLVTGNIPLIAGSIAAMAAATPDVAVPILRMYGMQKDLVSAVMKNLRLRNAVPLAAGKALSVLGQSQPQNQTLSDTQIDALAEPTTSSSPDLQSLASQHGFDLNGALSSGYTSDEIQSYLQSLGQNNATPAGVQ